MTWLGIAGALLVVTAAPSSAQTQADLVGAYAGTTTQTVIWGKTPTLIVTFTVVGYASPLGQFTAVGQQTVNLLTGTYVGNYTVTVPDGDTLTVATSGVRFLCSSAGIYTLQETFTITGGTGYYSGATGSGTGLGVYGSVTSQIGLALTGTLEL